MWGTSSSMKDEEHPLAAGTQQHQQHQQNPGDDDDDVDLNAFLAFPQGQEPGITVSSEDDEEGTEEYVPESLREFVNNAKTTLMQAHDNFLSSTAAGGDAERGGIVPALSQDEAGGEGRLRTELLLKQQGFVMMSPEAIRSPPPHNPVSGMTDSQIKRSAMEDRLLTPGYPNQQQHQSNQQGGDTPTKNNNNGNEAATNNNSSPMRIRESYSNNTESTTSYHTVGSKHTPIELIDVTGDDEAKEEEVETIIDVTSKATEASIIDVGKVDELAMFDDVGGEQDCGGRPTSPLQSKPQRSPQKPAASTGPLIRDKPASSLAIAAVASAAANSSVPGIANIAATAASSYLSSGSKAAAAAAAPASTPPRPPPEPAAAATTTPRLGGGDAPAENPPAEAKPSPAKKTPASGSKKKSQVAPLPVPANEAGQGAKREETQASPSEPGRKSFFDRISDRLSDRKAKRAAHAAPTPEEPQPHTLAANRPPSLSALEQMQESAIASLRPEQQQLLQQPAETPMTNMAQQYTPQEERERPTSLEKRTIRPGTATSKEGFTFEVSNLSPLSGPSLSDQQPRRGNKPETSRTIIEEQVSPLTESTLPSPSKAPPTTPGSYSTDPLVPMLSNQVPTPQADHDVEEEEEEVLEIVQEEKFASVESKPGDEQQQASKAEQKEPTKAGTPSPVAKRSPSKHLQRQVKGKSPSPRMSSQKEKQATGVTTKAARDRIAEAKASAARGVSSRLAQGTAASQSRRAAALSPGNKQPGASPRPSKTSVQSTESAARKKQTSPRASSGGSFMKETAASQARTSPPKAQTPTAFPDESSPTKRQTTPRPISGGSFMKETASSQARTSPPTTRQPSAPHHDSPASKRQTPPRPPTGSGFMKGTAASQARISPPKARPPVSSPDEARAKARERIRHRLEQEQRKLAAESSPARKTRLSADEGIARAQARVREMHMKQKKAIAEKENARKANLRPRLTVPAAPKFASSTKATTSRRMSTVNDSLTLGESASVMQRGLRDDASRASATSAASRKPRLTIPKAPNFALNKRYGERLSLAPPPQSPSELSLARSTEVLKRGLRDGSPMCTPTEQRRAGPTVPRPPDFATTRMHGEKTPSARGSHGAGAEITLARSSEILQHELRRIDPSLLEKRDLKVTLPKSPKLHKPSVRPLPQSTSEKEKEMMEYYKAHPFKARPFVKTEVYQDRSLKKPTKRNVTAPAPFRFSSRRCRSIDTEDSIPSPVKMEQQALEEAKKQFRALPLPKFDAPPQREKAQTRKPFTTPKPFNLSSSKRTKEEEGIYTSQKHVFRARPAPKSTFHAPPVTPLVAKSPGTRKVKDVSSKVKPPNLRAVSEASRKRADDLAREREQKSKERQREQLRQNILKAEASRKAPAVVKKFIPFELKSAQRHEESRRKLEEKRKEEEAERKQQAQFHARTFQSPPQPKHLKVKSDRPPTTPEPFHLNGLLRHQFFADETKRKLEAEAEERKAQTEFKAKPVPKTTYVKSPLTSPSTRSKPRTPREVAPSGNNKAEDGSFYSALQG